MRSSWAYVGIRNLRMPTYGLAVRLDSWGKKKPAAEREGSAAGRNTRRQGEQENTMRVVAMVSTWASGGILLLRLALVADCCERMRKIRAIQNYARRDVSQLPVAHLLHGEPVVAGHL